MWLMMDITWMNCYLVGVEGVISGHSVEHSV